MSQDKNQPQPENGNGNDLKKIEQQYLLTEEYKKVHPHLIKAYKLKKI